MIRIAAAQINPTVGDLDGNRRKIISQIRLAKTQDADVIAFPELAISGYPPEDLLHKDHFVRDNIKILRSIVKEAKGITVVVGFVDSDKTKKIYNAAAIIDNQTIKGIYRKEELPNYGVFDEKRYFHPGKNNKNFSVKGKRFGVSICEDIWIDKGACHKQVKSGAKFLINISSSPYDVGKLKKRIQLLKKRAKQFKVFICYVNCVGGQDELVFDGSSLVINPKGQIVAAGKQFEEDLMIADLEIGAGRVRFPRKKLVKQYVFRRLNQNERIYQALVLGTRDYTRKNGFHKAVLGISGGIDSALVATIAVDALGKDNVIGVTMPSRYTSSGTKNDAHRLAENLNIHLIESPIEKIFKIYLSELKSELKGAAYGLAEENLQARIRGNILMTLSNKFGWLVLTTGNKSEVAVGYCTLYGDMSGGFAVIKDVPKVKVYELAEFRNQSGKCVIPRSIIKRAPSAELRSNQKDLDSLPPYDILDSMLKEYVEKHRSLAQMTRNHSRTLVKKIVTMVDRSEYKRRQGPPGIKISQRAFGRDWRLPITNLYRE